MRARPLVPCCLMLALLGSPGRSLADGSSVSGSSSSSWEAFPRARIFPAFLADGTHQQFSLVKDTRTRRWIGSIGGLQHLVQFSSGQLVFQAGVGATVYASLIRQPDVLQVLTADFFVDIPLEVRVSEQLAFRTGYGHHSGHLADDGIEMLGLRSINYAKDYLPLFAAWTLPALRSVAYGGARFDYYTIPERDKHWIIQTGIQGGDLVLGRGFTLYGAIDLKARSEVHWRTTQSYQLGVRMLEREMQAVRIAFTYRTGPDERGQFYQQSTRVTTLGAYLDF